MSRVLYAFWLDKISLEFGNQVKSAVSKCNNSVQSRDSNSKLHSVRLEYRKIIEAIACCSFGNRNFKVVIIAMDICPTRN